MTTLIFILATATTLLGVLLLGIKIPHTPENSQLHMTRGVYALSFFIFAIPAYFQIFSPGTYPEWLIGIVFLLDICAYLSQMTAITIATSPKPGNLIRYYIPLAVVIILASLAIFIFNDNIILSASASAICLIAFAGVAILFHYGIRHYKEKAKGRNSFFKNDAWTYCCFYFALYMTLLSIFSNTLPKSAVIYIYNISVTANTIFNVWLVSRFFNYVLNQRNLHKAKAVSAEEKTVTDKREQELHDTLDRWVRSKEFLKQDDGMEEVAKELGTDLEFLRQYFRTHMDCDFRTWRIRLRIEYAKKLLAENPDISMNTLATEVGFPSRSNFYYQFKKITGKTPIEYKEQQK